MSFNRKSSQSKSDSRVTEVLRQYPRSKIETINKRLISTSNQIPIPTRNINQKKTEQKQNKENTRYNNISDKSQKENNVRYNNYSLSKNEEKNNTNKNTNTYNNKNEQHKTYKFDISKYRNKNKKENDDIKINKDNPMSKSENIYKLKNENSNINNNINKRNINNNSLKNNNQDNNENKFKINIHKYTFVYNKNTEPIKTPRIKISEIIDKNNNSSSYYNQYSPKTSITISNRRKINHPVKIIETETSNRRNNKMNNSATINKNNSFSAGLNLFNHKVKLDKKESSIPHSSFRHYNISQPISIINQNKNKSSNYLLGENQIKERAHSSYKNSNIYLNTDFISNQKEEENINKNKSIITRIVSHRKNNNINTNINKDNNKNENKYNSYSNTQIKNDKKEIKEKEVKKVDNKKNNNIIQRKEEKIYISKKPQIAINYKDNKENNNVSITYISNIKKIDNKKNSSNNTNDNNSATKNISSNNNSITYIKTSSSKKEKNKVKNENIIIPNPKNLNNYYSSMNTKDNTTINNINKKSENNLDINSNSKNDNIDKNLKIKNENESINIKNESQINNNIDENESKEKNITPIKSINILENNQNNDINIEQNSNINKLIENYNSSIKNLTSSAKLEQKIKELESKLDDLNNNSNSAFNISEPINIDYDYKYSLLNKPGLSDITKEYLSSFLEESMPKTELSDFSRAYMIKLDGYNMNDERPTLSGLTKEFLRENDDNNDKKEEINNDKQADNI